MIWLKRMLLLLLSGSLGLGLAELGARALGYSALHDVYSRPSMLWQHDPLLGWSHVPGSRDTYVGPRPFPIEFRTEVVINQQGLRGPEIGPKPDESVRILVLGDSMVAAFEVEYRETFAARAQEWLQNRFDVPIEVINAGVRGYGTDQSYLYYRDRGVALDADIVVLAHSANDHANNVTLHRMRRPLGKAALRADAAGRLEAVASPIPQYPICSAWVLDDALEVARVDTASRRVACWLQTRLSDHSALFSAASTVLGQQPSIVQMLNRLVVDAREAGPLAVASVIPLPVPGPSAEMASREIRIRHTLRIVGALQDEAQSRGATFVFLMSPPQQQELDLSWPELHGLDPIGLIADSHIPDEAIRFKNDGHYTAAGHKLWAERLVPVLIDVIETHRPDLRARGVH